MRLGCGSCASIYGIGTCIEITRPVQIRWIMRAIVMMQAPSIWRHVLTTVASCVLANAGGCVAVTASEPLYDAAHDRRFDPGLLGEWSDGDDFALRFEADGAGGYLMDCVDPGLPAPPDEANDRQAIDLVAMDGAMYLFVRRKPGDGGEPAPTYRVWRSSNDLQLWLFNGSRLYELVQAEPRALRDFTFSPDNQPLLATTTSVENDRIIAHAASGSLRIDDSAGNIRRLLAAHADDPELWMGPMHLQRVPR